MREALLNTSISRINRADALGAWMGGLRLAVAGVFVVVSMALLGGCSGDAELPYEERPVEQIYNKAMDYMADEDYAKAANEFEEVERQHPYSTWARRATLMAAYADYKYNNYDASILTAQRYISLHPGSKDVAYAYYLIALCYYEQISDVGRDQQMTENALAALTVLSVRFPQSEYARDARLKLDLTRDHLAGKEMEIGRYYLKRREYIAAINRFRVVIEKYQTTTHVPEALHRLVEAYLSLGIKTEAQTAAAILGYNYPGSDWYQDSYALLAGQGLKPEEDKGSWISKAWHTVF
ncbi:outer membrane protein assembly factor BamD [Parvibaculum sp.]|uniref:outer membrane protein assembly factor BamD n=1 Tax=Parvibaculum sp. TaxID=2024848 RepID=UPI00320F0731